MSTDISRRQLIATIGGAAAAAIVTTSRTSAQGARQGTPLSAPTVISNPPRDFGPDAPPTTYFADPDILSVDPAFDSLIQANTSIKRLWTGALWAEGPAWNSVGRFLMFSDIAANKQMRWLEDDGDVTVFRDRPTTATATPSTSRDARCRPSTSLGASCATSTTAR